MIRFKKSLAALSVSLCVAGIASPAFAASHQVKGDETFYTIAAANGFPLQSVLLANPGVNPKNLQEGQTIQLPEMSKHTIVEGDTFFLLSLSHHVSLTEVLAANPGVNPWNLIPGQKVNIPSSSNGTSVKAEAISAPAAILPAGNTVKTASGQVLQFERSLDIVATAYSSAAVENGKWGAVDYNGNPLKMGTIAVDPRIIPMGSKVYITGYSNPDLPAGGMIATATDQGSAIKGNRIDIFLPGTQQRVSDFGIQNVKVYLLK